ncbi:hypothetical protein ACOMHN_063343 [Nucella lapillus]
MLNRKHTVRRGRRRSSGNKPRRCSAPTVLGPPRMHVTLFPSNEDIPSRLCSTPVPPNASGHHVAHSVDSGTSWLRAHRMTQYGGQGSSGGQLSPSYYGNYGFNDKGSLCSSSQVRSVSFVGVTLP